jgi:dTDP-4-amino-4,6-dideoxygalactose transaminase
MTSSAERPLMPIALPQLGEAEAAAVTRVLQSGWVTQGPEVAAFEMEFAAICGAPEAVAVSNCTTALHLVLHALGVGLGDEVITVSHSFVATANAIRHCGAEPVFVDIQLDDFNMDPAAIEPAITAKTKAIVVVHQLGMPARLAEIAAIAKRHGLLLVEDAACAVGSEIRLGNRWQPIGAPIGIAACFSFHPRKLLTTGDGGMITTFDHDFAARLRRLRQHGMSVNDRHRHLSQSVIFESYDEVGFNYRLTDIQAAIGREQLKRLPHLLESRRLLVEQYQRELRSIPGLIIAADRSDTRSNWQSFHILLPDGIDQMALMERLLAARISSRRGVMCAHLEPAYQEPVAAGGARQPLRRSEIARDRSVLLPLFPEMTAADVTRVVTALAAAVTDLATARI